MPVAAPKTTAPQKLLTAPTLFLLLFASVALTHLTLLQLPYYWDEGGYYVPAALDFYHRWTLIPEFTNAHPPLPNVVLGLLWHIVGYHIVATRLCACAFAAAALVAVFRLTERLLNTTSAIVVTALTAVYPIWFAQSSLAHADIFAAAFTLSAFALYLPTIASTPPTSTQPGAPCPSPLGTWDRTSTPTHLAVATLFTLSALSKETAILQPATLAAFELYLLLRKRGSLQRLAALSFPVVPLLVWYAYHHHKTGFTFGNPEYLRYNATANLTTAHILQALYYRFLHLAWQRNIWLPLVLTAACLFLTGNSQLATVNSSHEKRSLTPTVITAITLLIAANWLAFSILGGALLTRYLLPIYPLILLVCVAVWQQRTKHWHALAAFTAVAFIAAIWLNPPTSFAPEDNLTYRDMIVVHQQAVDYVAQHYPDATVLTAWPVAADLFRPELGYTQRSIKVFPLDSFSIADVRKAAAEPDRFDTAIAFTQHYVSPPFLHYLQTHPDSARGKAFAKDRELSPQEIASLLGGRIVWQNNINGEWAAVIHFNRSYAATLELPVTNSASVTAAASPAQ